MKGGEMQIPLADAIQQLRDELRKAVLEGKDEDIVFTPNGIDLELGVNFATEAKAGGGFKVLALLDLSADASANRESQHRIKLSFTVADKDGKPIKVRSDKVPKGV
jgi:Trypsin-co-occurring domain 2